MSYQVGLAQYSCDHCKQRKLRCSREIPTCRNCKAWDGDCVYSRNGKIRRRPRSKIPSRGTALPESHQKPASHSTATMPNAQRFHVDYLPEDDVINVTADGRNEYPDNPSTATPERLHSDDSGQALFIGPSPIASFLSQANSNIGQVMKDSRDSKIQKKAEASLADLSSTFAALGLRDGIEIRRNVQKQRRQSEVFFIPEKAEGEYMMKLFAEAMDRGTPFFRKPPQGIIPKIVFEPSTVKERGWILLFNVLLSTDLALMKPPNLKLSKFLQWNTWMLMEDSSILLEPSEINIRALIMLAVYGQEITTPNLCWTLMTHACQMAQTLALHLPISRLPPTHELNQHRSCLFWCLFLVDQALALSVGRPPLLPAHLYNNAPQPDPQGLALYRVHKQVSGTVPCPVSLAILDYGAFYISQNLELAKFQGRVSEMMYRDGRNSTTEILKLKIELDQWMEKLNNSPFYHIAQNCKTPHEEEVKFGVDMQKFQYHHLIVYLTRVDKNCENMCLDSAREAISLLEHLVPTSGQIFTGIIWQFLYQPFTPYFVLFSHVISHPISQSCFKDLQFLRKAVLYFLHMNTSHPSAGKLERVAETFTQLAETYVRHSRQLNEKEPKVNDSHCVLGFGSETTSNSRSSEETAVENTDSTIATTSSDFSSLPPLPPLNLDLGAEFNFNDMPSDPMALLNFYTPFNEAAMPYDDELPEGQDLAAGDQNALLKELRIFEQNGTLDGTFDWFSWDLYDSSMS